ncbi:hypothetical protein OGV46_03515, partial [Citrobacter sp. Cf108]|uniref:hypothetical protein n=1 Tax=Citrobacter sp. Cf108 TaxID=2985063 RepID=UPI0025785AB2
EVKRRSADGSVGSPHARVGNCQASNKVKKPILTDGLFCVCAGVKTAGLNVLCRPDKRSASRTSQHHRVQSNILSLHNTSHPAVYAVN